MAIWAWWIMAVSYPVLVAFSIMAWNGSYHIGIEAAPGPDDKMIIVSARPGSDAWHQGARSGDVLLELDGVEVTRETWQRTGDSGDSVKILSLPDQALIESSVSQENNPGAPLVTSFFIVSLVFALSSFFVFYRANHTPQTLALSVLFVVMALAFAAAPAGARQLNWATDILQYTIIGSAAMFFAFFSSFTLAPERIRKQNFVIRPLLVGMAVWAVAVGILYLVSVQFLPEIYDAVRKIKLLQIGVGFLGGVIFLTWISQMG
jgi:uncharacterized membrane protein YbhN (UPF0104 family)